MKVTKKILLLDSRLNQPDLDQSVGMFIICPNNTVVEGKTTEVVPKEDFEKALDIIKFYAEDDNYRSKNGGHIENRNLKSNIGQDCGRIARKFLSEWV